MVNPLYRACRSQLAILFFLMKLGSGSYIACGDYVVSCVAILRLASRDTMGILQLSCVLQPAAIF